MIDASNDDFRVEASRTAVRIEGLTPEAKEVLKVGIRYIEFQIKHCLYYEPASDAIPTILAGLDDTLRLQREYPL